MFVQGRNSDRARNDTHAGLFIFHSDLYRQRELDLVLVSTTTESLLAITLTLESSNAPVNRREIREFCIVGSN